MAGPETPAAYNFSPSAPQPSTMVPSAPAPQIDNSGPRAMQTAAQADADLARGVDAYSQHLDQLQAQDAVNQLRDKANDLQYGPTNGFMTVKGGNVLKPAADGQPMLDSWTTRLNTAAADISKDLSPAATRMFNDKLAQVRTGFRQDLMQHSIQQTDLYHDQVFKDGLVQDQTSAAQSASDPAKVALLADRSAGRAAAFARSKGMDPDVAAMSAKSTIYRSSIEALAQSGAQRQALTYYESVLPFLDARDRQVLGGPMRAVSVTLRGTQAADEALARIGLPGIPNDDGSPGGPRENNIGNVRPVGSSVGFQGFPTFDTGVAGTVKNLRSYPQAFNGGKPMTLEQIGQHWAPSGDGSNDPAQWARNVGATAGIDPTQPIDIDNPTVAAKVARGVHAAEWGGGKIRPPEDYVAGTNAAFGGPRVPQGEAAVPAFKGDVAEGYRQAAAYISQRPDMDPAVRQAAITALDKRRVEMQGIQSAATKSLTDEANSTLAGAFQNPSALKPGTFSTFADRARSLGEQELARTYDIWGSLEPTLRQGLAMARPDQIALMKNLATGLPKHLLDSLKSSDPEALATANDVFAKLKQRQADGLPVTPPDIAPALKAYGDLGRTEKMREVAEWGDAALQAGEYGRLPKAKQDQGIADLRTIAANGQMTEQQATLYHMLKEGIAHQDAGFRDDAFSTGTQILGLPVQPLAFNDSAVLGQQLGQRGTYVTQIRSLRPDADVVPFTNDELGQMRDYLAKGNSQGAVTLYQSLSALPRDLQLATAARLNGKGKSDDLSQMYAAGMAAFPGNPQAAQEIVRGADILKNAGDSQKKLAATSPAFQTALSDQIGNALTLYTGTEMPSEIVNAAKAVYAWRAQAAGKQYDQTPDADLLRQSIDAVTGGVIDYRGQKIFAPRAGMSHYDVDTALSTLRNDDLPAGLKSGEGTPITADMIARKGVLYSYGDDQYVVKLPDRGGDLKPILDPRTGQAWTMPFRPLLDRRSDAPVTPLGSTMPAPKQGQRFLQGWALPQ